MIEWLLILGLGWFSYDQHEKAVTAEVSLSVVQEEVTELHKVVKVWEGKNEELAESNTKYEDAIRSIANENAEQRIALEGVNDDVSRDYLDTPVPACIRSIITEGNNEDTDC